VKNLKKSHPTYQLVEKLEVRPPLAMTLIPQEQLWRGKNQVLGWEQKFLRSVRNMLAYFFTKINNNLCIISITGNFKNKTSDLLALKKGTVLFFSFFHSTFLVPGNHFRMVGHFFVTMAIPGSKLKADIFQAPEVLFVINDVYAQALRNVINRFFRICSYCEDSKMPKSLKFGPDRVNVILNRRLYFCFKCYSYWRLRWGHTARS